MAVQLRSSVHFDRTQLRALVGNGVHELIEEIAQELLDIYAAGWPRGTGPGPRSGDTLRGELVGKAGYRTDFRIYSDAPHAVWVERRHYPIRANLDPHIREAVRGAARSIDWNAIAARTGANVGQLKRNFYARAIHTGRQRSGRRRPSRAARQRRAGSDFRRGLRVGARGFGGNLGRGIRTGQRIARRATR